MCLDSLPQLSSNFVRMECCGKGMHKKCYDDIKKSSMSQKQKNQCIMCRTVGPKTEEEQTERVRRWADKGKAWAQSMLGGKYYLGKGVDQSYQQAKELLELAATQGNVEAQCSLGIMYQEGQGVDQSYEKAAEYFDAAATQGYVIAQFNLGRLYVKGQGVNQSYERAAEYYEAAARQGYANAQYSLGHSYATGQGVEESNETARELWTKAAEQGNENAIKGLQILDENEGRTTPSFIPPKRCSTCNVPKTSINKLRNCKCKGAQYCDAKCQKTHWKNHQREHRRLCKEMKLVNTEGVMKDEVVEEMAAKDGETKEAATADSQQQEEEEEDVCPVCIEALQKDDGKFTRFTCCGKGMHLWCADGIDASTLSDEQKRTCPLCRAKDPTSNEEAIERLLSWVEKGKAWAQCTLGQFYYLGVGVVQSYQRARELYELASSQGHITAQYNLGVMYYEGQGVDQIYEKAAEYFEAIAMQGHANAQYNLGTVYGKGQGVEQSNETARAWLMKAAEQGHDGAIIQLQKLDKHEGKTTPSFIPKPFECASCYRPHDPSENKLNACNRCHRVYYCGRECQVKHWKRYLNGHKQNCNCNKKSK